MAIEIPSDDVVVARALAFARNRFSGKDLGTESFLGKKSRAEALLVLQLLKAAYDADADSIPTTRTSTAALDIWATALGLSTSTAGVYGRRPSVAATGGITSLTGTKATVYPDALTALASDGTTQVKLSGSVTISGTPPGTGSVTANIIAVTTGTVSNLPAASVMTWQSPPAGADATFALTTKLSGGVDLESNRSLLDRIIARLQTPPKGGTSADFRGWAEAVAGMWRAYPYPLRGGLGTAHVVITAAGSGLSRDPGAQVKLNVDAYINGSATVEGHRTVTAQGYTTLRPYMPAYPTGSLKIRCRMTPGQSKYNFDWTDTTFTVASYAAGPPAVITMTQALPATLMAAVDAGNAGGSYPRLQVQSTTAGALAVNPQVLVKSYSSGAKTLTLENPLPTNFTAPSAGDTIYAGGPGVATAAAALQAYLDGLGPSRSGGYADPYDGWEDSVAIYRLAQICLDAADGDGGRFYKNVVSGGLTIAVGNGAAAATDVTASDIVANGAPELLYARLIAVTQ